MFKGILCYLVFIRLSYRHVCFVRFKLFPRTPPFCENSSILVMCSIQTQQRCSYIEVCKRSAVAAPLLP